MFGIFSGILEQLKLGIFEEICLKHFQLLHSPCNSLIFSLIIAFLETDGRNLCTISTPTYKDTYDESDMNSN
jgi:hypothetical protein